MTIEELKNGEHDTVEYKQDIYGVVGAEANATDAANTATDNATNMDQTTTDNATDIKLSKNEMTLLHYVKDHPATTQKEASNGTGITIGTVKRLFPALQKKMILKRNGNHKNGSWEILIQIHD